MALFFRLLLAFTIITCAVHSGRINLPTCSPPDYPRFGSYGPVKPYYEPGDIIHYYCDVETYIAGNYLRICQDSGDWTGDTPLCDVPMTFTTTSQTSTAEPTYANEAEHARDGDRSMCSSTKAGPSQSWSATFPKVRELLRVMVFLPRGDVNYDVISIREDGQEFSCGGGNRKIERLEWVYHNCLAPNNQNIVGIKVKSLSDDPLQICELVAHGLTDPTCVDPHRQVQNGRLVLTRKKASVECNKNYSRDRINAIACIQTGVWEGMRLQCIDHELESERLDPRSNAFNDPDHW